MKFQTLHPNLNLIAPFLSNKLLNNNKKIEILKQINELLLYTDSAIATSTFFFFEQKSWITQSQ